MQVAVNLQSKFKGMFRFVAVLLMVVHVALSFIELYETEHAQQQLADEVIDVAGITKAKELLDKMKAGVGGSTIAVHYPSGKQFIHRNKWIMLCNGVISKENGHCNGNALESVTAFRPESASDYCYIKTYHSLNDTLCLSPHSVNITMQNNTVVCESTSEYFPARAITIEDYLKICEKISSNVTYVYFANEQDEDHVEIPNENPHVRCENFVNSTERNKTRNRSNKHLKESYKFADNRTGVCVFNEQDKLVLKLLQYLKL